MSEYAFSSSTNLNDIDIDIDIDHEKDIEKLRAACKKLVSERANLKNNARMEEQKSMTNMGIIFPSTWNVDITKAYLNFCDQKRIELRASHPNATYNELGRMADELWTQLSSDNKLVRDLE